MNFLVEGFICYHCSFVTLFVFSDILEYFETTWIGRLSRGGRRRRPRFCVDVWNQYDNVKQCLHRTNNFVEGWHNGFNRLLGATHPTIWKVIDGLKKQQTITVIKIEQFRRGDDFINKHTKRKVSADSRIKNLADKYDGSDKLYYISGISHCL